MNGMRILMIAPQPFFTPRGTPFSVYYRTKALAAMGHKIDLVTYHLGRNVEIPNTKIHRIFSVPFVRHIKIGPSFLKLVLDVPLFLKAFFMLLRNKYDVVHAHEEGVFFCLVYRIFFWRLKIIYDMHSSLPQQLKNFNFTHSRILIGIFSFLEMWAIRWSRVVITICPELQKAVQDLKLKTPHILIENSICDAIDLSDPGDVIPDDLINWDRFKDKKMVLYTGTFEYYQGIPMLLESVGMVASVHPDVVFVLIGGAPHQLVAMRRWAEKLGVKDHVLFTGNIHPNTVKCFIRRADMLVSPRIRGNNTPLKIYEYLASGKPIVATDHHAHTQVLTEKEAMLADPNPRSFAKGILEVLNQPHLRNDLGNGSQRLYESSYSAKIYTDRLKKVFQLVGEEELR